MDRHFLTCRRRWFLQSILISLFCFRAEAQIIEPAPYVLHVVVDALSSFYLHGFLTNAPGDFPNFTRLMREGAYTFNARCDYDESTTTANHGCLFTGRPAHQPSGQPNTVHHGFTYNDPDPTWTIHANGNPYVPYKTSVFDVVHEHGLSTAFYASKVKLRCFTNSWNEANGEDGPYGRNKLDLAMITDALTNPPTYVASEPLVDSVVEHLDTTPWNYAFLHFEETDYVGHYFAWGGAAWSNAVRHVDSQLGRIFAAIDARPALAKQLFLIVTADHGGGGSFNGFSHDSNTNILDYTTPFFLWGPGITPAADLYSLFANRSDPGTNRLDYNALPQPLRDGDSPNLALALLGLPPIPGSFMHPVLRGLSYRLALHRAGGLLRVSWPVGAEIYMLESTTAFSKQTAWTEITSGLSTDRASKVFEYPYNPQNPMQFFRLRKN
jgi:hypothetical protein